MSSLSTSEKRSEAEGAERPPVDAAVSQRQNGGAGNRARTPTAADLSLANPSCEPSVGSSQLSGPLPSPPVGGGLVAVEAPLGSADGSVLATPRPCSSSLSSPLLSSSFSPSQPLHPSQQQQGSRPPSSRPRGSRGGTARLPGVALANGSSGSGTAGGTQDYVDVVIRLKPVQKRMVDAYMAYTIESGSLPAPGTTRKAVGERTPGTSTLTPRTARAAADGATPLTSARTLRTARDGGSPTHPSRNSLMATPASNGHLGSGGGASGTVLTLTCPTKVANSPLASSSGGATSEERRAYEFGQVLDCNVSDAEMCQRLVPGILEQIAGGYNTCVLCYGQTGSGKTHTITALAPFLTEALFSSIDKENDVVEVSYIQIYNDRAYDLLGKASSQEEYGVPLPRPTGVSVCEPKVLVRTASDVMKRIAAAQKYRCTSTHRLNARSSRSHTLLSLHVTRCLDGVPMTTNKVTLADLAGSERVKRSGAHGEELTEAIHINKSLHTLHSLIIATAADSEVLPYRESLLTRYLAPRLREWHILLIVTASLEKSNAAETKSSLEFATTAKRCVVTKRRARTADRAMGTAPLAADLEELCERLQAAVAALRHRVEELQGELAAAKDAPTLPSPVVVAERERQMEIYKALLCEREAELLAIRQRAQEPQQSPRGGGGGSGDVAGLLLDEVGAHEAAHEAAREQVLELLSQLRTMLPPPPRAQPGGRDGAAGAVDAAGGDADIVDNLGESFLWLNARLNDVCEQYRVLSRGAAGLRADNGRLREEAQRQRQELDARAASVAAAELAVAASRSAAVRRLHEMQDRHAAHFLRLTNDAVRGEMADLYGVPLEGALRPWRPSTREGSGHGGVGVGAAALPSAAPAQEQKEKLDSMAAELAGYTRNLNELQQEFDDKERSRIKLEKDLAHYSQLLANFWRLATLAQKGHLLSPSAGVLTGAASAANSSGGGGAGVPSASTTAAPAASPSGNASSALCRESGGSLRGSVSGATAVAQGLLVVRLQAELRELKQQLSSTEAKAADRERQYEEQQRAIAELRLENDKLGAVVVRSYELMRKHEEALKDAEVERNKLLSLIDAKTSQIYDAGLELERAENVKLEMQRQTQQLLEQNAALQREVTGMERQNRKHEAALRTQEHEAAERLKAAEEAYKAKILKLEWRLHKRAADAGNSRDGAGGLSGSGMDMAPGGGLNSGAAGGPAGVSAPSRRNMLPSPILFPRVSGAAAMLTHPSHAARATARARPHSAPNGHAAATTRPYSHARRSAAEAAPSWLPRRDRAVGSAVSATPAAPGGSDSITSSTRFNGGYDGNDASTRLVTASGSTALPHTAPPSQPKKKRTVKRPKTEASSKAKKSSKSSRLKRQTKD